MMSPELVHVIRPSEPTATEGVSTKKERLMSPELVHDIRPVASEMNIAAASSSSEGM